MSSQPTTPPPARIAAFISGGGTTLLNLHQRIVEGTLPAEIAWVVASRDCAGVDRARTLGYQPLVAPVREYGGAEEQSRFLFKECRERDIELVVLAGFLTRLRIPDDYLNRVMNIHPALIPAFAGQGMFGRHVHEAVIERGCKVSGCTVHFCDNEYDHGPIILQRTVPVHDDDDPQRLAARVFQAECEAYPEAIRLFATGRLHVSGRRVIATDASPGT